MARLWYRPSAAEFVVGLGAEAEILDEDEQPLVDEQQEPAPRFGRAALIPLTSDAFDVFTAPDAGFQTTDLLDENNDPISEWVSSDEFDTLGRGPAFQGPEDHEGDLFLSADGSVFYRVSPDTDTLYERLGAVEEAVGDQTLDGLANVDADGKGDGDTLRWNNSTGQWEADSPAGTGTVTSVAGVGPDGSGNVPLTTGTISAATAADMNIVKARTYVLCAWTGSGYEPKPAGFALAIRPGPQAPTSQRAVNDIWLQPEAG